MPPSSSAMFRSHTDDTQGGGSIFTRNSSLRRLGRHPSRQAPSPAPPLPGPGTSGAPGAAAHAAQAHPANRHERSALDALHGFKETISDGESSDALSLSSDVQAPFGYHGLPTSTSASAVLSSPAAVPAPSRAQGFDGLHPADASSIVPSGAVSDATEMYALGSPPSQGSLRLDEMLRDSSSYYSGPAVTQSPRLVPATSASVISAPAPSSGAATPIAPTPAPLAPVPMSKVSPSAVQPASTPRSLHRSASPAKPAEALVSPASVNVQTPLGANPAPSMGADAPPRSRSTSRGVALQHPPSSASGTSPAGQAEENVNSAPEIRQPGGGANMESDEKLQTQKSSSPNTEDDGQISEGLRNALTTALDTSSMTPAIALEQNNRFLPAPVEEPYESDSDASPWPHGNNMEPQPVDSLDYQITGFAVASPKRNADFHAIFPDAPEDDYLIDDYGCALVRDILLQGRLYVSENHLCFNSNIFGWVTNLVVPFADIISIEKRMTALVIPNAIQIATLHAKHTFASFLSRDPTYDVIVNIWKLSHPSLANGAALPPPDNESEDEGEPGAEDQTAESCSKARLSKRARLRRRFMERKRRGQGIASDDDEGSSGETSGTEAEEQENVMTSGGDDLKPSSDSKPQTKPEVKRHHPPTECEDGKKKEHYANVVLDTTYPTSVETLYNLLFTTGFTRDFLVEDQNLIDVEMGDWEKGEAAGEMQRSITYIKPLNGSIGPKQTKCVINETALHVDPDKYTTTITNTRTPDVPSGGSFVVKTRTCLTWAGGWNTRLHVTCTVEWTGRSFIRSVIDRASIDGQMEFYKALNLKICEFMKVHAHEFKDGTDPDAAEAVIESVSEFVPAGEDNSKTKSLRDLGTMGGAGAARGASGDDASHGGQASAGGIWAQYGEPAWEMIQDLTGTMLELLQQASLTTLILGSAVLVLLVLNMWAMGPFQPYERDSSNVHRLRSGHMSLQDQVSQEEALLGQALRQALQQALYSAPVSLSSSSLPSTGAASSTASDPLDRASPVSEIRRLTVLLELQDRQIQALRSDLSRLVTRIEKQYGARARPLENPAAA